MRALALVLASLLVTLAGCTTDGADPAASATPPAETAAGTPAPAASPSDAPPDAVASEPSAAASPDLSALDDVVEDLGVEPQTVLGVSITACAALAEGLSLDEVEQQLRSMEQELALDSLSAEELTAIVDAGVQALCPDQS